MKNIWELFNDPRIYIYITNFSSVNLLQPFKQYTWDTAREARTNSEVMFSYRVLYIDVHSVG